MLRKHSQSFIFLYQTSDIIILLLSSFFAYYIKFHSESIKIQYIALTCVIIVLWFSVESFLKAYESHRTQTLKYEISLLIKSELVLLFLISFPLYFLNDMFSRVFMFLFFLFSTIGFICLRSILRIALLYIRTKGYNTRRLIIAGAGDVALKVFEKVQSHPQFGYKEMVIVADGIYKDKLKPYIKGTLADLKKIINEFEADDVIITFPLMEEEKIINAVNICEMEGVRVRIVPDFFRVIPNRAILEDFDSIPLIGLRPEPLMSVWNRFIKRTFDICFSFSVLALLSPLYLLIIILIKITSRGPIFFIQERIGTFNKPFNMYKFRTMKVQKKNESDTTWTTQNDSRITFIGKIMRKTNLDELPQFFNVLLGNMSVVGPRPEREHFANKFAKDIPAYRIRHLVRVGITGWAQVNGLRGDTSIPDRIKHDHYYIENWSFGLDMKIIFKTVFNNNANAM